MPTGKIPETFAHAAVLSAAGVNTFLQLSKFSADYTKISGIGPKFAEEIALAVAAADGAPVDQPPVADTEPLEAVPEAETGSPCLYQADRDTIVAGEAFGIDPGTGVAARVTVLMNGRFKELENVRSASTLKRGATDFVGCYCSPEAVGAGA